MATMVPQPEIAFQDSSGNPYASAKLFVYNAGTTTKTTIYGTLADMDAATNALSNPIVLGSRGQIVNGSSASTNLFAAGPTKLVLAPSNDTDPPVSAIATWDNIPELSAFEVDTFFESADSGGTVRVKTGKNLGIYSAKSIVDDSGNELITFVKTASAVNELTVTNQATGTNPSISATGGDTNIGINITPKGTGILDLTAGALNTNAGADIASAATTNIGTATGNYVDVTGTTTITALGTIKAGTIRFVRFAGILTFTHNATSLILPGNANITTAAGDVAIMVSLGSGNWKCINYMVAATAPGGGNAATQADMETATSTTTNVTPGRQHYHPAHPKAMISFSVSGGTPSTERSYNMTSLTDNGVGDFTANFTTAFSANTYGGLGLGRRDNGAGRAQVYAKNNTATYDRTTTADRFLVISDSAGGAEDPKEFTCVWIGDQ